MTEMDFMEFLTQGDNLLGVSLNDRVSKLHELLGKPLEIVGNKKAGFFHYKGLRYGYFEDKIDEIAVVFYNEDDLKFNVTNEFQEDFELSNRTFLHRFMYFLSSVQIGWECRGFKYQNGCTLVTKKKVHIEFDLETGFLHKIYVSRI